MIKQEKPPVVKAFSIEYRKGRKREKTVLLNKRVKITGYSRKHLIETLSHPLCKRQIKRQRKFPYPLVFKPLKKLWVVSNYACGKRLVPMPPTYLSSLGIFHEVNVISEESKQAGLSKFKCQRSKLKGKS